MVFIIFRCSGDEGLRKGRAWNMYNNDFNTENGYGYHTQGTYQDVNPNYQAQEYHYNAAPQPEKKKKKGTFFGKMVKASVLGLLFGAFGSAGFYAVQEAGTALGIDTQTAVEEQEERELTHFNRSAEVTPALTDDITTLPASISTTVVTDVTDVVSDVMPSIVSITNNGTYNYYYYSVPSSSSGSGIIIGSNDEELLIVTNYHVVEGNEKLYVTFVDDTETEALVKGTDASMDLAVIAVKINDLEPETFAAIKIATMGDSDALKVGEPAIAIGNALGYGQSVTTGVISAVNRRMDMENTTGTFIQTDAAINPGNSGGALLNIRGEVVGINSNKIGGSAVEGMGYAIPISAAQPIIEDLMQRTTRTLVEEENRGYLGITGATVTSQEVALYGYPEGVYVANVNGGSAAETAGLQRGDYIIAFDGQTVTSMEQLQRLLMYYEEGTTAEIKILRPERNGYREMTLEVTLGDKSVLGRTN
ncbi:MAG: trypsin-like peptidase domain-containing protein [Lachnospiraceae bacterium]|nr:trypsin-like peptidase domain-containing protein [Lachnospiraceae bacterium]